jgi:hypothetical protein
VAEALSAMQAAMRAVPAPMGRALIAACIALSASATDLPTFATGEIAWNTLYPIVLSYVIGLAASLDPRGRWAVLVGSASSLGTAAGPLTGSVLSARAGFPVMGLVLAAGLLAIAVPMTAVALTRRPGKPAGSAQAVDAAGAGAAVRAGESADVVVSAAAVEVVEIPLDTAEVTPAAPGRLTAAT